MKKITICFMLLITVNALFSQENKPLPALTKQDYLEKSKNQKNIAFTALGVGIVLKTSGIISMNHSESKGEHEAKMILSGLVISTASIPLFIISRNNRKKAKDVALKIQALPVISDGSFVYKMIPSINIKINL